MRYYKCTLELFRWQSCVGILIICLIAIGSAIIPVSARPLASERDASTLPGRVVSCAIFKSARYAAPLHARTVILNNTRSLRGIGFVRCVFVMTHGMGEATDDLTAPWTRVGFIRWLVLRRRFCCCFFVAVLERRHSFYRHSNGPPCSVVSQNNVQSSSYHPVSIHCWTFSPSFRSCINRFQ